MKVLVATDKPFAPIAVEGIRTVVEKAGYKLSLLEKYTDNQQFLDAVADANALIVRSDKVTAEVLAAAHNLKIVVRAGAGYDNLDLEACTRHGVVAMNTPGQNSNAVAELAFGMMVYNARGGFDGNPGTELRGKKLGIHAYGNVGKYVAGIARGFGMDIYAYDPFVSADVISSDNVKPLNSADDLYSTCQYVSLHLPANNETKGSIGFNLLTKMPHNAVLVNTARKEVINEEELLKVMATRPDFSYLSDIAPDCASEFAEKHPGRFFFTPKKMGAQTSEANINAGVAAAEQIVAFIKDGVDTFKVN